LKKTTKLKKRKKEVKTYYLIYFQQRFAHELKANGKSEPRFFNNATVMFTDFKDFTVVSEKITATELVEEIDYLFRVFDLIIENNNLEKNKNHWGRPICAQAVCQIQSLITPLM
jgi:class 3 adenylate cyclase